MNIPALPQGCFSLFIVFRAVLTEGISALRGDKAVCFPACTGERQGSGPAWYAGVQFRRQARGSEDRTAPAVLPGGRFLHAVHSSAAQIAPEKLSAGCFPGPVHDFFPLACQNLLCICRKAIPAVSEKTENSSQLMDKALSSATSEERTA